MENITTPASCAPTQATLSLHSSEWHNTTLHRSRETTKGRQRIQCAAVSPKIINSSDVTNCRHTSDLVGDPNLVTARVNGKICDCLINSCSQVTCITEPFFHKLPNKTLYPLSDLEVTGADGTDVPYLGYTDIDESLPRSESGIPLADVTLALVCPDGSFKCHFRYQLKNCTEINRVCTRYTYIPGWSVNLQTTKRVKDCHEIIITQNMNFIDLLLLM